MKNLYLSICILVLHKPYFDGSVNYQIIGSQIFNN